MSMRTTSALTAALLTLTGLTLASCGGDDTQAGDAGGVACSYPASGPAAKPVDGPPKNAAEDGTVAVTIATNRGDLHAELDGAAAPCTVNSFLSLAQQEYFDNTPCHRLTTSGIFVLQCGDPTGSGTGGPGYRFDDELTGKETYKAGTLAMANAGPNTNGSQFFVVYGDTSLNPDYTVFGTVDAASVDLITRIARRGTDGRNGQGDGAPKQAVTITSVTTG